jgi:hypothetical protein
MADIVKDATEYRIKQIEIAEAQYYKSLVETLDRIEFIKEFINHILNPFFHA